MIYRDSGLRINVGKTKILGSSSKAQKPTTKATWPCGVCTKGVGENLILCQSCNLWVHNRCSGVKGAPKKESMFSCRKCKGEIVPPDSLNSTQVHTGEDIFEAVSTFDTLVM